MLKDPAGSGGLDLRKAVTADGAAVQALVNRFAGERMMLSRSLAEIYENIRDFFVVEDGGAVVGSAALHVFWSDLAEVRALAIAEQYQRRGLGRRLVEACTQEARRLGVKRVFALTFQPEFFRAMGFAPIDKHELPHKVWSDCMRCPLFPDCDEEAFILEF